MEGLRTKNTYVRFIVKNWYWLFVGGLLFLQAAVFLFFRKKSYIAVHDNLDLFVAHLQILKNTDTAQAEALLAQANGRIARVLEV